MQIPYPLTDDLGKEHITYRVNTSGGRGRGLDTKAITTSLHHSLGTNVSITQDGSDLAVKVDRPRTRLLREREASIPPAAATPLRQRQATPANKVVPIKTAAAAVVKREVSVPPRIVITPADTSMSPLARNLSIITGFALIVCATVLFLFMFYRWILSMRGMFAIIANTTTV